MKLKKFLFILTIVIIVNLIESNVHNSEISLECDNDVVGIICHLPKITHTTQLLISSVPSSHKNAAIVEIALKNHSNYLPLQIGSHFSLIENLIIHKSELKFISKSDFATLRNLEVLSLFNNKIESIPHDAFHDLTQLRHLDIESNFISQLHPQLLIAAPNLKVFAAAKNKISEIHENLFDNNQKLWKINLSDNQIEHIQLSANGSLLKLIFLSKFNLRNNLGACDIIYEQEDDFRSRHVKDSTIEYKLKHFKIDISEKCRKNNELSDDD